MGCADSVCVVSIGGLAHDWATSPHSTLHRPHSWSAQDTQCTRGWSGPGDRSHSALSIPHEPGPGAEITKAMLQFPQGWPCLSLANVVIFLSPSTINYQ